VLCYTIDVEWTSSINWPLYYGSIMDDLNLILMVNLWDDENKNFSGGGLIFR